MQRHLHASVALTLCVAAAGTAGAADQVIFRVIAELNQYAPATGITEGSPGIFYLPARGAVVSMTAQGSTTLIGTFYAGLVVPAPLLAASNGLFYSTYGNYPSPSNPNPGNVFSVGTAPGSLQTYATQIATPALTQTLPDGTLFGFQTNEATFTSYLVVSDLSGNVTPIYQFPHFQLVQAALYATDGNYYAVVSNNDNAYVCRVTPAGSLTKLTSLGRAFFSGYQMSLIQGSDGNLYGTTPIGGYSGTVYQLTLDGQYTLLYTFTKGANSYPTTIIEGSDGNLYGATEGYLSPTLIFRLTTGGQFTQLHEFQQSKGCPCMLTQGSDGMIYGTTAAGAPTGGGGGNIFVLYAGLPKPRPRALQFNPTSGPVGTQVLIWGHNLLAPSVEFNGVPASQVLSSGPNYIWATVPAGAATGPITVTTPGGTSTTHASFVVQ